MSSQVGDRLLPTSWCLEMDLFCFPVGRSKGLPTFNFSAWLSLSEVPGPQSIPFPIGLLKTAWAVCGGSHLSLGSVWDHTSEAWTLGFLSTQDVSSR